jgi:hypothetical protein
MDGRIALANESLRAYACGLMRYLEFLHFSRGAGRGESAIRKLKIGSL